MEYKLYHGTEDCNVPKILKEGFLISDKKTEWLGEGIYFYDNILRAKNWVRNSQQSAIVQVQVQVDNELILDFRKYEHREKFKKVVDKYLNEKKITILAPNTLDLENKKAYIRCGTCNLYCKLENVGIIIAEIVQNLKNRTNCYLRDIGFAVDNDLQYCVKSNEYIVNKEIMECNYI